MPQKQITQEAIHTAQSMPLLNMRRKSHNEELTLKYKSKVVMFCLFKNYILAIQKIQKFQSFT